MHQACFRVVVEQARNSGIYSIEIESKSGFFATIQAVLFILIYCDQHKLQPQISARGGPYGDPTGLVDWFGALFEPIDRLAPSSGAEIGYRSAVKTSRITGIEELGLRRRYDESLTLAQASTTFNAHFRPRPELLEIVNSTCQRLSISDSTLAVHYRGTDKFFEAGHISPQLIRRGIERLMRTRPNLNSILIASDEQAFIELIQGWSLDLPVKIAPSNFLSVRDKPVHASGHPGLEIGREALVTCLLLSRCGFLVKTPSYLSGWAKIFNPSLPVWLLSPLTSKSLFPDRALWDDQLTGRVPYGKE